MSQFSLFPTSIGTFCPNMDVSSLVSENDAAGSPVENLDVVPYVSNQMRKILQLLKKANNFSLLPFETVFPASKTSFSQDIEASPLTERYILDSSRVDVGYTECYDIDSNRIVFISAQSAQNLPVSPGIYSLMYKAVIYRLTKDRPISLIPPYNTDLMGVNPEILTEKGYTYTMELTDDGQYEYEFMTYIIALTPLLRNKSDAVQYVCPDSGGSKQEMIKAVDVDSLLDNLQWRYIY